MSDAKLMMPLFCNGMFNCGGRRIRAVHLYDVSDGEHRYRLWTKAGTPDIDYPRVESDRYLLYVEIHGYLAPLGMTEYFLTEHCGYLPAMRELYGGQNIGERILTVCKRALLRKLSQSREL